MAASSRSCVPTWPLVLLTALFPGTIGFAQQQPIRVNTNLVQVNFTARDAQGALVTTLSKDDIEILEDSTPQSIAFFAPSTDCLLTLGLVLDISGSQSHFGKQHQHDLEASEKRIGTEGPRFPGVLRRSYPADQRLFLRRARP